MFNESLKPTRSDVNDFLDELKPILDFDQEIPLQEMMIIQDKINEKFKVSLAELFTKYLGIFHQMIMYNFTCRVLLSESESASASEYASASASASAPTFLADTPPYLKGLRDNSFKNMGGLAEFHKPISQEEKEFIDAKGRKWFSKNKKEMEDIAITFVDDSGLTEQEIIKLMEKVEYDYISFKGVIDGVIYEKNKKIHEKLNAERIKQDNKDWLDERLKQFEKHKYKFLRLDSELEDYVPPPGWEYNSDGDSGSGYYYNELTAEGDARAQKRPKEGGKRTKKSSKSKKKRNKTKKKKTNKRKKTKRSRK
jgi:hypothetical protein